ncbi:MAG: ASCH domain-containing protein [Acidilobus sp.]
MDGKGGVRGLGRRLKFKKRYLQLIIEGRKRSTIRLGRLVLRDRLLTIVGDRGPIALARVDEVIYKKVRELTDEDARVDGFRGLIDLFRELRRIYGDFGLEDDVTIIRFTVLRRLDNEGQDLAGLPGRGSSRGSR